MLGTVAHSGRFRREVQNILLSGAGERIVDFTVRSKQLLGFVCWFRATDRKQCDRCEWFKGVEGWKAANLQRSIWERPRATQP